MEENNYILIQGEKYFQPEEPLTNKIRGYQLLPENQVWYRDTEYLKWEWNTIDNEKEGLVHWYKNATPQQKHWYEREIDRIHNGCWVYINGTATYFNNWCYFFHQWFVLMEGYYPTYKDTSLEYFRFFEICWKDPFTLGDVGIKGRRIGLSSMSASIKLLIGLIFDNTLQGIVSKTGTDAQEMFFMVKNGLENIPEFLMPDLNKVTDSEIHIAKPARRITANNTRVSADRGKNNRINWLDTAENAYDGRAVKHVTVDEAAKWERVNVQICISKITETLVKGAIVKGHMSVFSTVNKGDKGGDNFKAVWYGSDHIDGKKDRFGRTETKCKRFFFEGYRGFLGYIGKYGESVIEDPTLEQTEYLKTVIDQETGFLSCPDPTIGAKEYLMETRKMKAHDEEAYAEEVRKYPFFWKEVFKGANNQCHFDLDAINNQIERVETKLEKSQQKENGRQIEFTKDNDNYPKPKDSKNGFWYILEFPEKENINKSLRVGSIKCPSNVTYGAAGLDTYANAKATVEKGSDACCIIQKRYDALDPDNSGMPVAMFIGRPKTKKEFHEQIFWGLEYYGVKMLAERSPTDWEDYAIEKFYASDLEAYKKVGYLCTTKRSDKKDTYGISPQDKEAREQHLTEMVEYSINNMGKIWFLRILKDMVGFNINDRTIFDACMAWGYSLMAVKETIIKQKDIQEPKKILITKHSKKYY
jgi:hypothetical protein